MYFHVNYTLTVNETAELYSFILISCFLWECISYFHLIEGKYSHRLSKNKLHVFNFLSLSTYIIVIKFSFFLFTHFKTFYFNIRMWYFIHVKIYYTVRCLEKVFKQNKYKCCKMFFVLYFSINILTVKGGNISHKRKMVSCWFWHLYQQ